MPNKFALDTFAYIDSPIHRWSTQYKIIGLLTLIFAFSFVRDIRLVLPMLFVTGLYYFAAKLPKEFLFSKLKYPGFFLLGIILMLPFQSGNTILWEWSIIKLRQEGCLAVVLITTRFVSIFTLGLVLFGTSPFLQTIYAMRNLGLPMIMTDMLLLTYRYLYQLGDDLEKMQHAMALRGFCLNNKLPKIQVLQQLAALIGSLLIRSYEQSERVYAAMRLRGYGLQTRDMKQTPKKEYKGFVLMWLTVFISISFVVAEILS